MKINKLSTQRRMEAVSYTHLDVYKRQVDTLAVTLWKGIAQTTSEVAQKGDTVAVKGRIQSHTFEGNDGQQHRSYDIIAEYVSLIQREGQS